jgi:hypothetical protein
MTDKPFFEEPTDKEIKDRNMVRGFNGNLIRNILRLYEDQTGVIEVKLIPGDFDNARKFMKHGDDVKLQRFETLEEISREMPIVSRRRAFDKMDDKAHCCYSFKPVVGVDKKTRRVSLVECLEGAKIYGYVHQVPQIGGDPSISVKSYHEARGVEKDGAEIIMGVPSRTEKEGKHKFAFESVPVVSNDLMRAITYSLGTDHVCDHKRYMFRFKSPEDRERSKVFDFCAHEVAGYLAIIDQFKNEEGNNVPLWMNQFAIPTQDTADFYDKLGFNCLIKTPDEKRPRKLTGPEKEVLLWGLVHKHGHEDTFYADFDSVKDYRWRQHEVLEEAYV